MNLATAFWVVYIVCLILCLVFTWPAAGVYRPFANSVMFFVLIGLLGWGIFGGVIKR